MNQIDGGALNHRMQNETQGKRVTHSGPAAVSNHGTQKTINQSIPWSRKLNQASVFLVNLVTKHCKCCQDEEVEIAPSLQQTIFTASNLIPQFLQTDSRLCEIFRLETTSFQHHTNSPLRNRCLIQTVSYSPMTRSLYQPNPFTSP
jgi:hypothetical protein